MANNDEPLSQLGQTHENAMPTHEMAPTPQKSPSEVEAHAELQGNGAIAQGPGSVAVAGDVYGPIHTGTCLLYTSPSTRDRTRSRMPFSA